MNGCCYTKMCQPIKCQKWGNSTKNNYKIYCKSLNRIMSKLSNRNYNIIKEKKTIFLNIELLG